MGLRNAVLLLTLAILATCGTSQRPAAPQASAAQEAAASASALGRSAHVQAVPAALLKQSAAVVAPASPAAPAAPTLPTPADILAEDAGRSSYQSGVHAADAEPGDRVGDLREQALNQQMDRLSDKWRVTPAQAQALGQPYLVGRLRVCLSPYTPDVYCQVNQPPTAGRVYGYAVEVFKEVARRTFFLDSPADWSFSCMEWTEVRGWSWKWMKIHLDLDCLRGGCFLIIPIPSATPHHPNHKNAHRWRPTWPRPMAPASWASACPWTSKSTPSTSPAARSTRPGS